jgi:hypothetical protein
MTSRSVILGIALATSLTGCKKLWPGQDPPEARPTAATSAPAPAPPEVPTGYVAVEVAGVAPTSSGNAVLLVYRARRVALPIFISGTEALSIQLRLARKDFVRPLSHDLFDAAVGKLGGRVESVRVDKLEQNTFYGTVVVTQGAQRFELDARPSDGIALALGARAPVHVKRDVLERAGVSLDELPEPRIPGPSAGERPDPITL